MGLAASQARFLHLTNQLTAAQFRGQSVNQQRTAIANQINQMMTGQSQQAAAANPFFNGSAESSDYLSGSSRNSKNNQKSNSNSSNNAFTSGSSIVESLFSAASQYPGANKSSMQLDSSKLAALQSQDARLEALLCVLGTQEKALKTEIEAVTKVIDKNVESSFKLLA